MQHSTTTDSQQDSGKRRRQPSVQPIQVWVQVWDEGRKCCRPLQLLNITVDQQEAFSGPLDHSVLQEWATAVVGQAGELRLENDKLGEQYEFTPIGNAEEAARRVIRTIIPSTELNRVPSRAGSSVSSTTSGGTSEVALVPPSSPCPSFLTRLFPGQDPQSATSFLFRKGTKSARQAWLRRQLKKREGGLQGEEQTCPFTSLSDFEASRFFKQSNSDWSLIHMVCERASLSQASLEDLQSINGVHDPRVAVRLCTFFSQPYDNSRLTLHATEVKPSKIMLSVSSIQKAGKDLLSKWSGGTSAVIEDRNGVKKPLDIIVQFGHGARIFAAFGTTEAKLFAAQSPIAIDYRQSRAPKVKASVSGETSSSVPDPQATVNAAALQQGIASSSRTMAIEKWTQRLATDA